MEAAVKSLLSRLTTKRPRPLLFPAFEVSSYAPRRFLVGRLKIAARSSAPEGTASATASVVGLKISSSSAGRKVLRRRSAILLGSGRAPPCRLPEKGDYVRLSPLHGAGCSSSAMARPQGSRRRDALPPYPPWASSESRTLGRRDFLQPAPLCGQGGECLAPIIAVVEMRRRCLLHHGRSPRPPCGFKSRWGGGGLRPPPPWRPPSRLLDTPMRPRARCCLLGLHLGVEPIQRSRVFAALWLAEGSARAHRRGEEPLGKRRRAWPRRMRWLGCPRPACPGRAREVGSATASRLAEPPRMSLRA